MASKCNPPAGQDKEENRRNFPLTAAFVDEMRKIFGAGIKLVWAREGGREIGKRIGS